MQWAPKQMLVGTEHTHTHTHSHTHAHIHAHATQFLGGMEKTKTPYIVEENRRKAIRLALQEGKKNDMILLAGKGHENYQIIGKEKLHLDEREEVAAAIWEV